MVDGLWTHCCGGPGSDAPRDFAWWMRQGQQRTTTFFAPYGHAGAERVLEALELEETAQELAARTRDATPRELRRAFAERFP